MQIKFIHFSLESVDHLQGVLQENTQTSFIDNISELSKNNSAVLVLKNTVIDQLQDDIFLDRGYKDKRKTLSNYLLKHVELIPILGTHYSQAGRVVTAVNRLLNQANQIHEKNIYVLGVLDEVFKQLSQRYSNRAQSSYTHLNNNFVVPSTDIACTSEMESQLAEALQTIEIDSDLQSNFIGSSVECDNVRRMIMQASKCSVPVLIMGDTGTGKEVVAQEISRLSKREKIITMNCAAIPTELFEPELFGYMKGAFSHAYKDKKGLWEIANGGTLFLDEIGELSLYHQAKILRALADGKIRRVGADKQITCDTRIITATNRDLNAMVQMDKFRLDLYERLRVFMIYTPPLRNHIQDIPELSQKIWAKLINYKNNNVDTSYLVPELSDEVIELIQSYTWPGNVRELESTLRRLFSTFQTKRPSVSQLELTFYLGGQYHNEISQQADSLNKYTKKLENIKSIEHLKRTKEVISACELSIRPLMKTETPETALILHIRLGLSHRLTELDQLCKKPLLFHDEKVFESVFLLIGKIRFFLSLLENNSNDSKNNWELQISPFLQNTQTILQDEIERIPSTML